MSRKVTLLLCSGQQFDDIPVENLEQTLAEFLDITLKQLEVNTGKGFGGCLQKISHTIVVFYLLLPLF